MNPPVAPVIPHVEERHGRHVVDEYRWLRDRDDPRVLAYLTAENAYTAHVTESWKPLVDTLYREMLGRIRETDQSVPERFGDRYYYVRTEQARAYPIWCRRTGSLEAAEELLLDGNVEAAGRPFFRVGTLRISPDQRMLAWTADRAGDERYTLGVRDLAAGRELDLAIPDVASVEWGEDGRTLWYATIDAAHRPYRLWRHRLGSDPATDVLVREEPDPAFYLGVRKTRSRAWLVVDLHSLTTSEVWLAEARDPEAVPRIVAPRRPGVEYEVEHHGETLWILTNDQARDFRLLRAPLADPVPAAWREVLAHRPGVLVESADAFERHLVVVERERGLRRVRVFDLPGMAEHELDFPEPTYAVALDRNPEFRTPLLRFVYTSLVTPRSVFDHDMVLRTRELKKEEPVLGGYDRARWRSARLWAAGADGELVPISIVHAADHPRDGSRPLVLQGYGAYGHPAEPAFDANRLSLLERGAAFAIAHVRGGGELGRAWYDAGKLEHKRNTFDDFVAAAEHLIAEGWTSPATLAIRGGSAGGLLVGAVLNMRPELFAAAVANVPFVDVLNTMLDPTLPLTAGEWEEWGDPRRPEDYARMASYSPYDNVAAQAYPHLLVTLGLADPRVHYWEPAKWVARLRARKTDSNLLLLRANLDAGHGGASGRYERLRELAFEYAFLVDRLGLAAAPAAGSTP